VPGVGKLRVLAPEACSATWLGAPGAASNVTLCVTPVVLFHVTDPPGLTLICGGVIGQAVWVQVPLSFQVEGGRSRAAEAAGQLIQGPRLRRACGHFRG
jgi:hypothetical protein